MTIATKLPTMADGDLTTLHTNTKRLIQAGTPAQQTAAATLMPSIEAELDTRNTAKITRRADALAARRAQKAAAAAGA